MPKKPLLLAALALGVALATSLPLASTVAGVGLPNLVVNTARVQSSVVFKTQNFTAKDCAYIEQNLTGTGKRTLMRFDVSAANRGGSPIVLGNPVGNSLFERSTCHGHYHFSGYALYELFRTDPRTTTPSPVVSGRKQAFCLEDFERDPLATTTTSSVYTCSNQGISVGWADTYSRNLDGQWLDITGLSSGTYWLRVTINPYNVVGSPIYNPTLPAAVAIQESTYADNTAVVPVTIPTKISGGPAS